MDYMPVKTVEKPWGREIWIAVEKEYAGKILEIKKGHRTSMQYHRKKKESMYVYSGELKVERDEGDTVLKKGQVITLAPGEKHRLTALQDLVLIELSTPELEDVVRVEDDYGRK